MEKKTVCFLCYNTAQAEQGYQIGERHQAVKDIGNIPDKLDAQERPDENGKHIEPSVSLYGFLIFIEKIFDAAFTVVIPAKDCCKRKNTSESIRRNLPSAGAKKKPL